jgi:hypothetical protein
MMTGYQTAGWGHGKTFVRRLQCKYIGSGPVDLRDFSGSQAGRCIFSHTTIMTLWLLVSALILI